MLFFANPASFIRLSAGIRPWALAIALPSLSFGLFLALVKSPPDYQQGESVRIMYVHVPAAWMALIIYSSMAIASAIGLVWKHPVAELYTKAIAGIGACFTALCLITGSIWGKPMWGTWWVWDARLTSVLILFLLYVGYILLVSAFDDMERGLKSGAVLILVGAVNLPVIKFSVDWWNTLHQPASVLRVGGPTLDSTMLWPLLTMALGFLTLSIWLALLRTETEIADRRIRTTRLSGSGHFGKAQLPAHNSW